MLAGCLSLFVFVGIIGLIGEHFGGGWAITALILFLALGIWSAYDEKKKKAKNTLLEVESESVKHKEKSKSIYTSGDIQFWYTDGDGNFTHRNIRILSVDSEYLEGFDLDKKAERTFRIERMDNEIIDLSTGEILTKEEWLKQHSIFSITYKENEIDDVFEEEICFTGFKKDKREELELKAMLNGFLVRKSVTKNLSYLVCGSNAGPTKMSKAIDQGAEIISETEFLEIIGED